MSTSIIWVVSDTMAAPSASTMLSGMTVMKYQPGLAVNGTKHRYCFCPSNVSTAVPLWPDCMAARKASASAWLFPDSMSSCPKFE